MEHGTWEATCGYKRYKLIKDQAVRNDRVVRNQQVARNDQVVRNLQTARNDQVVRKLQE